LKVESERIRNKLTIYTEKNFLLKSKETKFNLEKFNERKFNENIINNIISNSGILFTNFTWLKYTNNSCRYDVFCTFYIFIIYDFIEENFSYCNENLKNIHLLMKNIKSNPTEENKNILWKYCINKKIDIMETQIENKNIVIDNGFGESGFIIQLFGIFKANNNFCLKEQRNEKCQICNNLKIINEEYHNHIICISESDLKFQNIETIISFKLIFNGLISCDKCKLGEEFPTCNIYYNITNYPQFLFVLFDLNSYSNLKINRNEINKLLKDELDFNDINKYTLKGCVTSPYHNHFTFYINRLYIQNVPNELVNGKNYYIIKCIINIYFILKNKIILFYSSNSNRYYDSNKFNNRFMEIKSLEDLNLNDDYFVIPYLLIYSKLNI